MLSEFDAILVSLAWELEVPALVSALRSCGVEPLRANRPETAPLVIAGGPLTMSNPDLLAPFCDAVFLGEADNTFERIGLLLDGAEGRSEVLVQLADLPGMHVPAVHGDGEITTARVIVPGFSPVRTVISGQDNAFGGAFLVEVNRGCPRGCTFCVVEHGRATRFVPPATVLEAIPSDAIRVGLVGPAVSDHPGLPVLLAELVRRGRHVTLSSLRADRVTPEVIELLAAAGLQTLTVAADGTSERVREFIHKAVTTEHLLRCAELARKAGMRRVRLYAMVGFEGETDADIDAFGDLVHSMGRFVSVAVSVSPFVPKRGTPLADHPFLGARELQRRVARLRRAVGGGALVRATSPREAQREWYLSHARGDEAVRRVLDLAT